MGNFPKFRPKNSKLSIFTENWHIWYLGGVDSESRFLKFQPQDPFWANLGPKRQNCPFCLKIGTHGISRMLILIPTLVFWNPDPKIDFWANLGQKSQSCSFCLKIGRHGISMKLILIPTLAFWIPYQKSVLGKFGSKKLKVVRFVWKFIRMVSRGCLFLFQHLLSEFQTKNRFVAKFRPKKSNLSILPDNWHTWYLKDTYSYSKISFLNFKT